MASAWGVPVSTLDHSKLEMKLPKLKRSGIYNWERSIRPKLNIPRLKAVGYFEFDTVAAVKGVQVRTRRHSAMLGVDLSYKSAS